jgi:sigma-B regulation protein RsbU (phosphoserine phosphatase)
MRRHYWQYALLIALFVIAASYQARFVERRMIFLLRPAEMIEWPVSLSWLSNEITSSRASASEAGVRKGDRLIAVNGISYTGLRVLADAIYGKQPGDSITLTIQHVDGEQMSAEETVTVQISSTSGATPDAVAWLFVIVSTMVIPLFCLIVGFYVVAIRPRDKLAWLMLALMLCFSQLPTGFDPLTAKGVVRDVFLGYSVLCRASWPLWMLLFSIYFPERFSLDQRWPWLKYVLVIPIVFFMLTNTVTAVGNYENFAAVRALDQFTQTYRIIDIISGMTAIGCFFAIIGWKSGALTAPDVRRRLKLMLWGTQISLMPMFVIVIISLIRGNDIFQGVPGWIVLPAIMITCLFPITLAYVIVVQRAMDLRVVIRQGVQYALAQNGVRVLQVLLSIFVIYTAVSMALSPDVNRPRRIMIIAAGITFVFLIGRMAERIKQWTDRRFFREAYNSEHILSELGEKVRTMVETGPLLETVARRVSESLHVPRIALVLGDGNTYRPAYTIGYETAPQVSFTTDNTVIEKLKDNSEPLQVYFDDPDSWIYKTQQMDGERELLKSLDTQLLLPLAVNEKLPGFISLGPKQSEEPYSSTDLKLLQSVATQTGLALENSRLTASIAAEVAQRERLNRELEIAREVQERLFPQKLPNVPGLDYCGACRPALGVGGDYYDFLLLPGDRFGIAIGDVSGKGIAAALLMASLQASLRGQAIQGKDDLADLMSNVNNLVYEASAENRYATFFYSQYEATTRLLTYVNAGHNPPMIFRRRGQEWDILRLEAGGAVVGLLANFPYRQETVRLERGDILVAFTDGISEAMNSDDEEWGEDCMIEVVKQCSGMTAADTLSVIIKAADAFVAGAKQHDDMTLLIARLA